MTPREKIRLIVSVVADEHGLTAKDIYEPGRFAHIHAARRAAIRAVAAAYPTLSAPQIGRLFRRHHTTVLHALGRVKNKTIWREA